MAISALLPNLSLAANCERELRGIVPSSNDLTVPLTELELKEMRAIFKKSENRVGYDTAFKRFKDSHTELGSDDLAIEFHKAIIKLQSRGLIKDSGVQLGAAPSAWRIE